MKRLDAKYPNACHFVVAHSHGGNIGLLAMRDKEVQRLTKGIVCLSTPFLLVRPRDFSMLNSKRGTIVIMIAFMLVFVDMRFEEVMSITQRVALSAVAFFSAVIGCIDIYGRKLDERSKRWAAETDLTIPNPKDLLIVRTIGDEASAALGGMHFAGWAVWLILRLIDATCLQLSRLLRYATDPKRSPKFRAIVGFCVFISMVPALLYGLFNWKVFEFGFLAFPFLIAFFFLLGLLARAVEFLPSIALIVFAPILCFVAFPFGPEAALHGILTEIIPESTPIGDHRVVQLDIASKATGLRHSEAYSNPEAIDTIVQWIERKLS